MYDANAVLAVIDDHALIACALGAGAFLANWVYFYACWQAGKRDRCSPMALWATTVFIAHDGSFLVNAKHWFTDYDGVDGAWMLPLFWCGLIVTFSFECIFFSLTLRYGRREYAPRLTQQQWVAYCFAALAIGVLFWSVTKVYLNDEIYLFTFLVTYGMCAPATIQAMIRRGDSSGVSPLLTWTYLLVGLFYVSLVVLLIGGEPAGDVFREPWFALTAALTIVLASFMIWLQRTLPAPGATFSGADGAATPDPYVRA